MLNNCVYYPFLISDPIRFQNKRSRNRVLMHSTGEWVRRIFCDILRPDCTEAVIRNNRYIYMCVCQTSSCYYYYYYYYRYYH